MPVPEPKILSHEVDEEIEWYSRCRHCKQASFDIDEDCPVLRLRAMADAVGQGTAGEHVKAVHKWHRGKA